MAKVKKIGPEEYKFMCPGCKRTHIFDSRWSFNGDHDNPTFKPSLDFKGGRYDEDGEWIDLHCHSFVTDGKIRFLSDCTHELAGQTVELEEVD